MDYATTQARVAVIELGFALVAHLAQCKLLLIFQVATNAGVFAILLATLGQCLILLPMQSINSVVEIVFKFFTWIWWFGLPRGNNYGRSEQEGPDYKGMTYPVLVHRNTPPRQTII
jgi:uncharacterized membrane protein